MDASKELERILTEMVGDCTEEVDPKDPNLLYKINPKVFKDYSQSSEDKAQINTREFMQAVKKLPFLLA